MRVPRLNGSDETLYAQPHRRRKHFFHMVQKGHIGGQDGIKNPQPQRLVLHDDCIAPLLKVGAPIRVFMQQHIVHYDIAVGGGNAIAHLINQLGATLGLHNHGRDTLLRMWQLGGLRTPGITEDDVGGAVAPSERATIARRSVDQAFDVRTVNGLNAGVGPFMILPSDSSILMLWPQPYFDLSLKVRALTLDFSRSSSQSI